MSISEFFSRSELTLALRSLRREWVVIGVFSMVANVLMLVPTIYMLQVYDRVMVGRSELTLLVVSIVTLFLFAVMAFTEWARSRLLVRTGVRLDALLGARVFSAGFESNVRSRSATPTQSFADLTEIRQFLTGPSVFAFCDLPWAPIYIGVLFLLHPLLGWVALGFALLQAGLAWLGHHRTVAPAEAVAEAQAKAQSYLNGKLRNAEAIAAMGMLEHLQQRWQLMYAQYDARHASALGLTNRITAWSKSLRYAQQSLSLGVGALLVINGQLSPGGMIAASVLMARALAPIDQLVSAWRSFISARSAFQRLERLLVDHPPNAAAQSTARMRGSVELRHIKATVAGRAKPLLEQINLSAKPGTVTVVLGPSGAGKSTLARVLVGVWPVEGGGVWLDGCPITDWSHASLGPQVGYLPQDTTLFNGSIAENIARFSEVDAKQVVAAAQCAGLHSMVLRLPKGYDTQVGEAGRMLSAGQRQRIALARALYGDPALVVLDEPNAHLDEVGETALLEAIRQLKERDKTIFMVTHRAGVLALADQVVVLREGRVQFQGPRDEVFAQMHAAKQHASTACEDPRPVPQLLPV